MLTEEIKQAILNGAYGVTRNGLMAIFTEKDSNDEIKPYKFAVFNKDRSYSDDVWLDKDLCFYDKDDEHPYDIIGLQPLAEM